MHKKALFFYVFFFSIFQIFYFGQLYARNIYEFFGLEDIQYLPNELKSYIACKYIENNSWWYLVATLKHESPVSSVKFSNELNKILTISHAFGNPGQIKLLDIDGNNSISINQDLEITSIAFNNKANKILATAPWNKTAMMFSLNIDDHNKMEFSHEKQFIHDSCVTAVFNKLDNQILTLPKRKKAFLSNIGGVVTAKFIHDRDITTAVFNNLGDRLLTASYDQTARIWDLQGNELIKFAHNYKLSQARFNPQGDKILTVSWGAFSNGASINLVKIFDINGTLIKVFKHNEHIRSATFCSFDNVILIVSFDGESRQGNVILWDFIKDSCTGFKHPAIVSEAILNTNENRILTSCEDRTAKLWHRNGKLIATFNHQDEVYSAAFNKKDDLIVTGSKDKTAKIWTIYKKATLEQILLRKLITLYLQIKKPTKDIQEIETLLTTIATSFNLDKEELLEIWESIDEKVQNSLKYSLKKFLLKNQFNMKRTET